MHPKKAEAPLTLGESIVVLQIDFTIIEPLAFVGFIKVGVGIGFMSLLDLGENSALVIAWVSS